LCSLLQKVIKIKETAAKHIFSWAEKQEIKGFKGEILKDADKTPLIYIEIDGTTPDTETILMYGHYDKQPPFEGWEEGLAPTKPVVKNGKLYGRGGADDGYAIYGSIAAVKICQT
jgi:acetylornithine deacetylase/succinyl-diaminopimelate desuccinylase-like protein